MRTPCTFVTLALLLAACSTERSADTATADTGGATVAMEDGGATDTAAGTAGASESDPDRAAEGGGAIPAGYRTRLDRPGAKMEEVKYATRDGRWEIQTGPAHIIYADNSTVSGTYTVSATIEQLQAPQHPEAFGLFIGGQDLDAPSQKYTYFLVRGTGEYLVKVRDGAGTRDVVKWTASDAVTKADASGKATYRLAVRVGADSVRFLVNGTQVGAVPKSAVPADGVAGLRINHNLRVAATPITISK